VNRPCLRYLCLRSLCLWLVRLGFSILGLPGLAFAQSQTTDIRPNALRLSGEEIQAEFNGQTHEGAYNFNAVGEARNNYTETHFEDGRTQYKEQGLTNRGVWFVNNGSLCFVYEDDMMAGGCFRVYKVENCYYFYSDQFEERADELDRDYWTARSVKQGETPQCDAPIS